MDFPGLDIFEDESPSVNKVNTESLMVRQRENYTVKRCPPQTDPAALGNPEDVSFSPTEFVLQ